MTAKELNAIPDHQKNGFPEGIFEVVYSTWAQMMAFLHGLNFVGDTDVNQGSPFERDGKWVVRISVG